MTENGSELQSDVQGKARKSILVLAFLGVLGIGLLTAFWRAQERQASPVDTAADTFILAREGAAGAFIRIISQPSGATVLLNGQLLGATPVTVEGLQPGQYAVRLEKSGCQAVSRGVSLSTEDQEINERLAPLPTGALKVDVKPIGAEVSLDGELIGNTPLNATGIPAGAYTLLIRKTNYDSYSSPVLITPGETQTFSGFNLNDKILGMMEGLTKSEPQRLAHYIDLGHYHFINDRLDDAVDVFVRGQETMQRPLDFNGPGYAGKDNMTAEEIALEQRLRKEDESRFSREMDKHRNWPRKDIQAFRDKFNQAQERMSQKNATSWIWAESSARASERELNYDRAARIYEDYIAAAPKAPELPQAYTALLKVRLLQRDIAKAREVFAAFYAQNQDNGAALNACGAAIYPYFDRMPPKGRLQVLEMAEQALRRGMTLAPNKFTRAQSLFDLGSILLYADRPKDAVTAFEQSIADTENPGVAEERNLRLGAALLKAGRIAEAETLYQRLENSADKNIRESAKTGMIYVAAEKNKQAPQRQTTKGK